ncbi:hypothetical protein H4F33_18585 [Pectobacterium brasiliense]|uniref:hypothetical protein n=1 Tax=Pectobacterium brasiliense TaxID=180957 RepID=UPI0015DE79EA|nr:hypothetical protein [Pectobacterium brasiliense]MBA0216275.1 hypothetical protein [Pectobacterium brasiliense]MBN3074083.1 hypothetical protein [Pectobacterium brasiliense]MBN3171559.1 hypothetical protein [Pectobacterium brasiliense]
MGMPLREYYPVKRAAELLNCEVGDLFHWASIGAIKLYVSFENGTGFVRFFGDGVKNEDRDLSRFTEEQFDSPLRLKTQFFNLKFANDISSRVYSTYNGNRFDGEYINERSYQCEFSGLWALPYSAFGVVELYDFQPGFNDFWCSVNNNMFVSFETDELLHFEVEDFYIVKSDFLVIKNCSEGEELPNYLNGGKEKVTVSNIEEKVRQERTSGTAKNAIKIMAKILYPDVCESPTNLANSLTADAQSQGRNGVIFDDATVGRWLKD